MSLIKNKPGKHQLRQGKDEPSAVLEVLTKSNYLPQMYSVKSLRNYLL